MTVLNKEIAEGLQELRNSIQSATWGGTLDVLPVAEAKELEATCEAIRLLSQHMEGPNKDNIHHLASILAESAAKLSGSLAKVSVPNSSYISNMRNQFGAVGIISNGLLDIVPEFNDAGDVPIALLVKQAVDKAYALSKEFERIAG